MAIIDRKMVELIGKFYKAQESMKFLYGDKYPKEVADTKVVVDKYKAAFKCDTLQAVKKCIEKVVERLPYDNGVQVAMLLATAVEMTEGILCQEKQNHAIGARGPIYGMATD